MTSFSPAFGDTVVFPAAPPHIPTSCVWVGPPPRGGGLDDLANLQAAVNSAAGAAGTALGVTLWLPTGQYQLSAPLQIGLSTGSPIESFTIRGAGRTSTSLNAMAGNTVGVVSWNASAWHGTVMSHLSINANAAGTTGYGLQVQAQTSGIEFERLEFNGFSGVNTWPIILSCAQGGTNGEFCKFRNIRLNAGNANFFWNQQPQALKLYFDSCSGYFADNATFQGTLFRLTDPATVGMTPGGGLDIINPGFTSARGATQTQSLMFDIGGPTGSGFLNSPITVIGGRLEWMNGIVLVNDPGNRCCNAGNITFYGTEFTLDNQLTASSATNPGVFYQTGVGVGGKNVKFYGCSLCPVGGTSAAPRTNEYLTAGAPGGANLVDFDSCSFGNFTAINFSIGLWAQANGPVSPAKPWSVNRCTNSAGMFTF